MVLFFPGPHTTSCLGSARLQSTNPGQVCLSARLPASLSTRGLVPFTDRSAALASTPLLRPPRAPPRGAKEALDTMLSACSCMRWKSCYPFFDGNVGIIIESNAPNSSVKSLSERNARVPSRRRAGEGVRIQRRSTAPLRSRGERERENRARPTDRRPPSYDEDEQGLGLGRSGCARCERCRALRAQRFGW